MFARAGLARLWGGVSGRARLEDLSYLLAPAACVQPMRALFWDPSGQHAGHHFPSNPLQSTESEFLHGDPHFPGNPLLSTKGKRSFPFKSHHMPPFSSNPLLDTERSAAYMLRGAGGGAASPLHGAGSLTILIWQ